jgi:hypothetical protein
MATTNIQTFSGDVDVTSDLNIGGETILGTATYRKRRDWNRNALAYVYLGNVRTSTTTGIRLDVSMNNSNSGYQMYSYYINLFDDDPSHDGGYMTYSCRGAVGSLDYAGIDIGYVYVDDGSGLYTYQLWLQDPTYSQTGFMDAYINCQGYYVFDTEVSDVAQGGAAPTNFNLGTPCVITKYTGNVGIGSTNPVYKLDVTGTAAISSNLTVGTANLHVDTNTGNIGIGTTNPTAQLTLGASSGSQLAVTDNTRLLSNTHYLNYGSDVATDFEQVLLQFYTGGTNDTDQSEYAGYIDVEMVAQRTQSLYYSEIFTARLNYILAWNEQNDSWEITTFVQENKSVSAGVPNSFTVFKSVPVFKYKYVDRQLQIYVSFNANYFRGYTSFTARVTSDAPADVSMPGPDALMASGTVGTAEIGMCYGYGAYAANVGIGTDSPVSILHVRGTGQTSTTSFDTSQTLGASIFVQSSDSTVGSGGSLVLGTYQGKFAAIKAGILDGTNNTMGNLHFMTRNATADATLTNRMTITNTGNVGIGVTNPTRSLQIERGISYISGGTSNNSAFEIVQQLGTDDYTFNGQHRAQFRIKSGLGTYSNRSLELALLDNGRGIMQTSAASEGYFPISINPKGDYNSTVSIGSYYSSAKLRVEGNVYTTSHITTAGNVGIGSYSPGTKLDVAGVSRFTQNGGNLQLVGTDHTYLEYYPDGTSAGRKAYVGYASADDNNFTISNSAGSGHIVLGSGNVGIAVSQDPFTKLTIGSSASADGDIDEIGFRSINNTANDRIGYIQRIGFYGKAEYSNTPILNGAIECLFGDNQHYPTYPGHSSTNLIFKTNSRGGGTGVEKMRITYDGRLGLGTTNPNQGNLTVSALGADPYFTGYDENAAADATDFTGLAHFKSTGSHGVIRISNSAGKTGSTRIDFNTRLGDLWGVNTLSSSRYRGTAPTAGRIMVRGEINDNYEDAYMTFHTCRDLRPDGQGGTGNLYERMRITSTGRVGIGTDSPNATLHVNGSLLCGSPTTHQTSTAGVGRHITRVTSDVNVTGLSQTVRLNGAQQSGIVKIHYQAGAANTSGALQHSCYAVIGFSWGGGTNFYTYEHSKTEKTTTTISFTVNTDGYVTLSVSTGSSFGSYCSLYTEWFYGATGGAGLYV